jgi:hypothetical protein
MLLAIGGAIAINYRVSVNPPGVHKKQTLAIGAASTSVLIDSPRSAVGDLQNDLAPLAQRTSVVALLISSQAVRDDIGRRVGIPGSAIAFDRASPDPSQTVRSNEMVVESRGYRISTSPDAEVPIISIRTQAPTPKAAIALADATSASLQAYVVSLQQKQKIAPAFRLQVRRLGEARGGLVNPGAGTKAGAVAFIGIFLGGCILILLVTKLVDELRTSRLEAELEEGLTNGYHSKAHADALTPMLVGGPPADDAETRTGTSGGAVDNWLEEPDDAERSDKGGSTASERAADAGKSVPSASSAEPGGSRTKGHSRARRFGL